MNWAHPERAGASRDWVPCRTSANLRKAGASNRLPERSGSSRVQRRQRWGSADAIDGVRQ